MILKKLPLQITLQVTIKYCKIQKKNKKILATTILENFRIVKSEEFS